jgi:hypothetical protein
MAVNFAKLPELLRKGRVRYDGKEKLALGSCSLKLVQGYIVALADGAISKDGQVDQAVRPMPLGMSRLHRLRNTVVGLIHLAMGQPLNNL